MVWVTANHPWMGPVLFAITKTNGVHLGDALVAVPAAFAVYCTTRGTLTPENRTAARGAGAIREPAGGAAPPAGKTERVSDRRGWRCSR